MDQEINKREQPEQAAPAAEAAGTLDTAQSCRRLTEYLEGILQDVDQARLNVEELSEPCRELGGALCAFHDLARELAAYSLELSKGNLSMAFSENGSCLFSGLKNLHANLKHMTWQASQVAKGDYSQHVSHLGEFSEAFNSMTQQLKARRDLLREEVLVARRRAEIIQSYGEMLVDLLDQRDEWLLVVDQESRKVVHCNKRPEESGYGNALCERCRHRLPIQSKILEWESTERYKVREIEEGKGACYRVISFPIEWEYRPSCVHIIMDISTEKMNARHLADERYHDQDTGVHNRLFLDEYMEQVLRERQDATLCYLDLEGVEKINASYGQKVGDAYIQNFVEIVRKNFRSGDTFARIRDDKFCLILTGNVKHLIERKMDEILTIFQRDDERIFSHNCNFKYSIIEIVGETNERSLEELLEEAEEQVEREKRKKKRREAPMVDFDNW